MKDTCYLILSEFGIERMTKRQPSLKCGEIAVRVSVAIADKAFAEPMVAASLTIPEHAIIRPAIDVAVEEPDQ